MAEKNDRKKPLDVAREVLQIEAHAIDGLIPQLNSAFEKAVELILGLPGRVVCTGMGKSGLIMQKVAATLSSTGTPAIFLHPAEATHGDLGMLIQGDLVLAASHSGTTAELLSLVETLKRLGIPLVAMTGHPGSPLASHADVHVPLVIDKEACPLNLAPTASTTATLAMGDALAMSLMEARDFTLDDFARLHPGGQLGKRLLKVHQLMHAGDQLPSVPLDAPMREAIYEMSRKGLGATAVVDDDEHLVGIITDGDLRRLLEKHDDLIKRRARDCMTPGPKTIDANALAPEALQLMERHRITSVFVCTSEGRLQGLVHIHDLWGMELF
jgi:arabinose-5-phosphate isomerase